MFKAVLLSMLLLLQGLNAAEVPDASQKQIRTMSDFVELERTLRATTAIDPMKANYYLGLLYLTAHKLDDGKMIYPDYDKALSFLEESLNEGNILAAYSMAMVFLKKQKVDKSIFVLHMTLNSLEPKGDRERSSGAYLAAALASIVLDFKQNDKEALGLAIMHLEKYLKLKNMPSARYMLSQLYLREGNMEKANRTLTEACSSTALPQELKKVCSNFKRE